MVCDQPFITSTHLNALIRLFKQSEASIIASSYANTFGVPAVFDQSLFQELLGLDDEQGAKDY